MDKKDISIQLYTTRNFGPYNKILKSIAEIGITNIELFGLETLDVKNFKEMMEKFNLSFRSSHFAFEALVEPQNIIKRAKDLNIKHIIVPAPPLKGKNFEDQFNLSEDEWIIFGKKLSSYVSIFEDNGLTLGYHNHSYEFKALPSKKLPIDCVLEHNENLKFEIDLGWAVAGGADLKYCIEKYDQKIIACHLKDFFDKDKNMLDHENQTAIGDGFIKWKKIIDSILLTNCELFILEHDDPKDYLDYTIRSLNNLRDIK